ncbi:DUF397 domain-containing protein [Streptomyces sp. NRRL WC-3742]|uniref:DUF397 domain-containing protein n=1 Tax=Streptomyces sp. NRRL WC-3742 TaxID=1463934 RepID=UPI0004CBD79A|nr:DUF397 domain-containing protein [Streptomyces sp. NRRL WC-3742]
MNSSVWQKSSYSSSNDECVEVRTLGGAIELRESDDGDIVVRTTPTRFANLLRATKTGEFDHHAN